MKNLIIVFSILAFTTACNEMLMEKPKMLATETYYNTVDEFESSLYAAYGLFSQTYTGTYVNFWYLTAMETDYAIGRGSLENISLFQGYNSTDISRMSSIWTNFYRAILNANILIENASKASALDQDKMNQFIAEAKFLRALNYFYMVRVWGGLPLRTEYNMLDPDVPRSAVDDVYELIISDLEYAEANLPESQNLLGRADKYAAKAVMSHVYLNMGKWSDARTKAHEVISSKKYSLINISEPDDYYNIFGPEVFTSSEEIFYLRYNSSSSSWIAYIRHHPNTRYFNYKGNYPKYADSIDVKMICDWDYNDLRKKFMLYNYDIGFGPRTMLFKKFIDPEAPSHAAGRNNFPLYRYSDVLLIFAEADCRVNNGPTNEGMEMLNSIHRRAYGKNVNTPSDVDFKLTDYSKDTFIDLLLKEGCYEQMDEGKRFFELKRTGKLKDAIKYSRGLDLAEKHLLWPIPTVETDNNNAIDPARDQNPGY